VSTSLQIWCALWAGLLIAAGASVVAPATAGAVTTRFDANGTIYVNGMKSFPIGLSEPPPRAGRTPEGGDALTEVTSSGVRLFRVLPLHYDWGVGAGSTAGDIAYVRAWNAAATARGAMTWVSLRNLSRAQAGTPQSQTLNTVVTALRGDPGLGMWKSTDEPNLHDVPASSLRFAFTTTRKLDPAHLWVTVEAPIRPLSAIRPYSYVTNVHGVDVYPVRWGLANPPLHSVGEWTAGMRTMSPGRPIFTTLQICASTSDDPSGSGRFVLPTRIQERFMMYDAIMNGARGLIFYGGRNPTCYSARDASLGWNWTFWYSVLKRLLGEIRPGGPVHPALLVPTTGLGMGTSDPYTRIMSRVSGDTIYVIAARRGLGTRRVTMRGLPLGVHGGRRLDGKPFGVSNGQFSDTFARYNVHVYRFPRP
jgi:hypothetical protein